MNDCVFCKIIDGSIPSKTIYEDEKIKVFMDINPVANGHLLLIPKKHIKDITELDDENLIYFKNIINNKITPMLKEKLNIEGLTIIQNNGYGQEVKHYHIHLLPRYQNDNMETRIEKENIKNVDLIYEELSK